MDEEYENIDKLYTSLFFTCQEDEGGWKKDLRAIVEASHPEGYKQWCLPTISHLENHQRSSRFY